MRTSNKIKSQAENCENKVKELRPRNHATIVYPDSAPDDWLEKLSSLAVPCFVSPLHDKDFNGDEPKKPHYHVMLMFDGKKSEAQVSQIFDSIGGVGRPTVHSIRGYARYLCHLDDPSKALYDINEVISFGGADYFNIISLPSDKYATIGDMMDYCDTHSITSYAELLRYARDFKNDWFRVLCDSGTLVIKEFLKSKSWECNNS